jgi:hypothetical protein
MVSVTIIMAKKTVNSCLWKEFMNCKTLVDTISLRSGFMSYLPSIQAVQHKNDLLDWAIHARAVQP